MGANSRRRREARRRQRAPRQDGWAGTTRPGESRAGTSSSGPTWDEPALYETVELQITTRVRWIGSHRLDERELRSQAEWLMRRVAPAPWHVIQVVLGDHLERLTDGVVAGGWGPTDLVELVGRCSHPRHVPALLTVLHDEARRNRSRGAAWLAALAELGEDPRLRFDNVDELASGLQVAAQLSSAPLLDAANLPQGEDSAPHPKLARVRALLAKAESTEYDEEAEALSAKAQELISRYALGRLIDERQDPTTGSSVVVRRIWLDAPYVRAKASLVHAVALANHAQAAVSERHGFSLVVGAPHDLDAIELLVTSLLVQANRAMLRHGGTHDRSGTSRTRSFRRSFLLAFAGRIGQRLREATEAVTAEDSGRFLPVLRDHDERIRQAFDAMVPNVRSQAASITNYAGWAAGVAAADVALLDVKRRIGGRAGYGMG